MIGVSDLGTNYGRRELWFNSMERLRSPSERAAPLGVASTEQFHAARATAVARNAAALEELASTHPEMRIEAPDPTGRIVAGELLRRSAPTGLAVGTVPVAINQGAAWAAGDLKTSLMW